MFALYAYSAHKFTRGYRFVIMIHHPNASVFIRTRFSFLQVIFKRLDSRFLVVRRTFLLFKNRITIFVCKNTVMSTKNHRLDRSDNKFLVCMVYSAQISLISLYFRLTLV